MAWIQHTHYVNLEKEGGDTHKVHNWDSEECEMGDVEPLQARSERDAVRKAKAYLRLKGCYDPSCGNPKSQTR